MKCKLTISRNSNDIINITFIDELSGIQFVDADYDLASFALALTGCARIEGEMEVRGLEYVGKKKVMENRSVVCPEKSHNRRDLERWLCDNYHEEGWLIDYYLGSQGSLGTAEHGTLLRFKVYKYVEVENVKPS